MGQQAPKGGIAILMNGWDTREWIAAFNKHAPGANVTDRLDGCDPATRYAVVWKPDAAELEKLPGLEVVFSSGAGVDHVLSSPGLPNVPIVRVVADDLTNRMSEYIVWQVLDHMRQGRIYREMQSRNEWRELGQPAAGAITVGIMGLGVLGRDAAAKLMTLGFKVAGWSRSQKQVDGVACHHGEAGLDAFLAQTDILVVLLPHTAETEGVLNHGLFARMKRQTPLGGPVLINAGRGKLQVEASILRALDEGSLMAASLDVFETEPLPQDSPLWKHPRVFVTPHAAANSDPDSLVPVMARQMLNFEAGKPLENLVDRDSGY